MKSRLRSFLTLMLVAGMLLPGVPLSAATIAQAASPNVVISQVYGGGGNSGATLKNDFIELFNLSAGPVDLTNWSVQYASSAGSSWQVTSLSGTLQPGQYYLVQEAAGSGGTVDLPTPDASGSIAMSATNGKVLLASVNTVFSGTAPSDPAIVDVVGYGTANFFEGSGAAPGLGNTTADLRANNGCTDTDDNAADFTSGAPSPRNTASPLNPCGGPPPNAPVVVNCGSALNLTQGYSGSAAISASNADGVVVDIAITGITPTPASGSITLSDLVPATESGGTATATVNVDSAVPAGSYAVVLTATNANDPPQTGDCTLNVVVNPILPIGAVQGEVTDQNDGLTAVSPYVGQTVTVQGVIYENTLARSSSGTDQYGLFIQNTAATADGNPNTSDGIFVFIGRFTTLRVEGGGFYTPQVGDEVVLRGPVSNYFDLIELSNPFVEQVVRSGVSLDAEVPAFEANPPDNLGDANRYWQRHEGMRALVPNGSLTLSGRDVFASTANSEIWLANPNNPLTQAANPYARRAFRDPHPLDDTTEQGFDSGNGMRIVIGGYGVKFDAGDNTALLPAARSFDTLTNDLVGGVYFSFSKYQIMVGQQPNFANGPSPDKNAPPLPFIRNVQYSLVTYNMENLYDYRNNPFSGCDFLGDSGCPGVTPPFDYIPASQADYETRLQKIASQIVNDLHNPDVIMAQEIENQDICKVDGNTLVCDTSSNANSDGKPDVLQELALDVAADGGPVYDAAFNPNSADDRGIVPAFLFRTDRAQLLAPTADDPVLGSNPTVVYRSDPLPYNSQVANPKSLNAVLPADVDTSTGVDGSNVFTRAPDIGLFRLWRNGIGSSVYTDVYLVDNHFSSTPDARVGQRTEQANYAAAIVSAIEAARPGARVIVAGDLNVYPAPDDPATPDTPPWVYTYNQLAGLYDQGLTNLYDTLASTIPVSAYSYVYQGEAQTLDQIFANPVMLGEFVQLRAAHINSDWAKDNPASNPRGTSDHDPQVARFTLLPSIDRLEDLVNYYAANGQITGNNTAQILLDRLEKARSFQNAGKQAAYKAQLAAFILQVQAFAPRKMTQSAANALTREAGVLAAL